MCQRVDFLALQKDNVSLGAKVGRFASGPVRKLEVLQLGRKSAASAWTAPRGPRGTGDKQT